VKSFLKEKKLPASLRK